MLTHWRGRSEIKIFFTRAIGINCTQKLKRCTCLSFLSHSRNISSRLITLRSALVATWARRHTHTREWVAVGVPRSYGTLQTTAPVKTGCLVRKVKQRKLQSAHCSMRRFVQCLLYIIMGNSQWHGLIWLDASIQCQCEWLLPMHFTTTLKSRNDDSQFFL